MIGTALTWIESDWIWSSNEFTWGEITLAEQVAASKSSDYKKTLTPSEQKKFVRMIFILNGYYWINMGRF